MATIDRKHSDYCLFADVVIILHLIKRIEGEEAQEVGSASEREQK
jgi:hypothetical protein